MTEQTPTQTGYDLTLKKVKELQKDIKLECELIDTELVLIKDSLRVLNKHWKTFIDWSDGYDAINM